MSEEINFAAQLLHALTEIARRRPRKEVFLSDALRAFGLPKDQARVEGALLFLRNQGCIDRLVPLSNGDLLLRVTGRALEQSD
jgi:hypothetical protein